MLIADVGLAELLWTTLWLFFLFMFIWVFIALISDIFRDHELSGVGEGPLGPRADHLPVDRLADLHHRPGAEHGRALRGRRRRPRPSSTTTSARPRPPAAAPARGAGPVDDLHRLAALRDSGTITEEEFQAMKARVVST